MATLDLIEREYLANCRQRSDQLRAGLAKIALQSSRLKEVRGLGLMLAVDVFSHGQLDPELRNEMIQQAFHRGLLLVGCGKAAVRFCPALCVTAEQIETALTIFAEVVAETPAQ